MNILENYYLIIAWLLPFKELFLCKICPDCHVTGKDGGKGRRGEKQKGLIKHNYTQAKRKGTTGGIEAG